MAIVVVGLSIHSEEDDGVQIDPDLSVSSPSFNLCFVGTFLTTSVINFPAMKSTLANLWRPLGGIFISNLGGGRCLFRLYHVVDANSIEKGGPCIDVTINDVDVAIYDAGITIHVE
ncbi:hypothetical protein GQ457_13G026580 [Hibiscus cannabinus]